MTTHIPAEQRPIVTAMPDFATVGAQNVIVISPLGDYHFQSFPMPLAIKALIEGRGRIRAGDDERTWRKGQTILFVQGREYQIRPFPGVQPAQSICVFFTDSFLRSVIEFPGDSDPFDGPRDLEAALNALPDFAPALDERLQDLHRIAVAPNSQDLVLETAFVDLATALFHELGRLDSTLRQIGTRRTTSVDVLGRLEDARAWMGCHLDSALTLSGLADVACMAPYHFHRRFTAAYGLTPHAYMTDLRLKLAADILRQSSSPIGDVCLRCGLTDASSFARSFKARYGLSPTQYRSKMARSA